MSVCTRTSRPSPSTAARHTLALLVLLAASLVVIGCGQTRYMVEQPDGSFAELTADEAIAQLTARQQVPEDGRPVTVVRNADGTLTVAPAGTATQDGQQVVAHTDQAIEHDDGTVTVTVDPTETSTLSQDVVIVDVMPSNDVLLVDGSEPLYLQVRIAGAEMPEVAATRLPLNLAIVIDRSGSMSGQKIDDVKAAAAWLVDHLDDDDHITLVSYASDVRVAGAGTLEDGGRSRIHRAIDQISTGGGTNLSGGLETACDEVDQLRRELVGGTDRVSRVLLLSDGNANEGVTSLGELRRISDRWRESGVSVTTMGVGLDYNEDIMETVATAGGGTYYFIENSQSLASIFETELEQLSTVVARETVVTLTLPRDVVVNEVFGFRHEQIGRELHIFVDTLSSGRERRALLSLDVPATRRGKRVVADAAVRYRATTTDEEVTRELTQLTVEVTDDARRVDTSRNREVVEKVERVHNAELQREVFAQLEAGNRAEAERLVEQRRASLAATNAVVDSDVLEAELADVDALSVTVADVPEAEEEARRHRESKKFKRSKKRSKASANMKVLH